MLSLAGRLSNHELLAQVKLLTQQEREATAVLIAHLAIFDERDLYLAEGCSSMFTYCVDVLHLSEHAAYGRIEAARAARKYPIILNLLSDGSVNLTTVTLLAPHLTAENHLKLLTAAKHQRKRQVEELVAGVRPQPDVPSTIRRLPTPTNDPVVDALIAGDGLGLDPRDAPPPALPAPAANARPAVVTRSRPSATKCSSRHMQGRMRSCGWRKNCYGIKSRTGILDK